MASRPLTEMKLIVQSCWTLECGMSFLIPESLYQFEKFYKAIFVTTLWWGYSFGVEFATVAIYDQSLESFTWIQMMSNICVFNISTFLHEKTVKHLYPSSTCHAYVIEAKYGKLKTLLNEQTYWMYRLPIILNLKYFGI